LRLRDGGDEFLFGYDLRETSPQRCPVQATDRGMEMGSKTKFNCTEEKQGMETGSKTKKSTALRRSKARRHGG